MAVELITKEDLDNFKKELLDEIRQLMVKDPVLIQKKWFNPKEARTILKISAGTLAKYRRTGTLPSTRIYGKIYYKEEDVLKLIENGRDS
jgi:hypothetical protein